MSFSQAYMQLLQNHEYKMELFNKLDLSRLFGKDFNQTETVRDLIYSTESLLDDSTPDLELYTDDGADCYYLSDSSEQPVNLSWEDGLEESFEQFLKDLCEANEMPLQFLKDYTDTQQQEQLLGCFYYSAANQFKSAFKTDYNKLKKEYPNEAFYPNTLLDTTSLFYYESSRCW